MNRTLLYGEGLFETIRWRGENERFRLHYKRLSSSAEELQLPCPSYDEFLKAIREKTGGKRDLYVKFCLLSKGEDHFSGYSREYLTEVIVKPLPEIPKRVSLKLSPYSRHSSNPIVRHKTMNYLFNILVKRDALRDGFFDGLILNEKGQITECSSSNLLMVKGSSLISPDPSSGLLKGTTLMWMEKQAQIDYRPVTLKDLEEADHLFITNSLMGIVPVERVGDLRKETMDPAELGISPW